MAKSSVGRPNKTTQKDKGTHFWFKQDGWRLNASLRLWQCTTEFLHETTLSSSALLTMNLRDSPTPEDKCNTDRAVRPVVRLNIFDSSAISGDHLPRKVPWPLSFIGLFIYFHYRQICRFILSGRFEFMAGLGMNTLHTQTYLIDHSRVSHLLLYCVSFNGSVLESIKLICS